MKEYRFKDLTKGQKAKVEVKITEGMLNEFSKLSGDSSPIHISEEFAKEAGFNGKVVHGLLLGSIVSRLVGMELPGKYGVLHSITLNFRKPCYVGDVIIVEGEITQITEAVKTIVTEIKIRCKEDVVANGKVQTGVVT